MSTTCHDCGVQPGQVHDRGCDVARCTQTGLQQPSCTQRHDCGRDTWTGTWPGEAECIEFGWYDPDSGPDLNRLRWDATWDVAAGRWRRREAGD